MSSLEGEAAREGRRPSIVRLARWLLTAGSGTQAAAIAYQMMFAFFPGLLLLKSVQDYLGMTDARIDTREVGFDLPPPVLAMVNDFMAASHGLAGDVRPLAELALLLLVLKGLIRVFDEYAGAFHAMVGQPVSVLRRKVVAGSVAAFAMLAAFALFLFVNAAAHGAPDGLGGGMVALAVLMMVGGVAGFFRLLSRGHLSARAVLGAAVVGVALWSAGTGLVFGIELDFAEEERLYGTLAAGVVLLLWFYVTARILLFSLAFGYFVIDRGHPA